MLTLTPFRETMGALVLDVVTSTIHTITPNLVEIVKKISWQYTIENFFSRTDREQQLICLSKIMEVGKDKSYLCIEFLQP